MQIKVCGLREKSNISEVINIGADYIGLIFYPESKRCVAFNDDELKSFIRPIIKVNKVGVFVNESYTAILNAVQQFGLHFVQLHGEESPDFCACLSGHVRVIKAFAIDANFDFNTLLLYEKHCTYFLFDTASPQYGGTGKAFDWELLKHYKLPKKYLLSGGISLENIHLIHNIEDERLIAIDVNSCFETVPGIKNIHKIKTLIHECNN